MSFGTPRKYERLEKKPLLSFGTIMVKRLRMPIVVVVDAIKKPRTGGRMTKRLGWLNRFGGFGGPPSIPGLALNRTLMLLLLLVPQIAQTKVAKSKGKLPLTALSN